MTGLRFAPAPHPLGRWREVDVAGVAAVAAGVAFLLARPWLARSVADPVAALASAFVCLGMVGAWWTLPALRSTAIPSWRTAAAVTVAGVAAFGVGRALGGGEAAVAAGAGWILLNTLAAVAEEAFFRRLVYGLLEPFGAGVAIAGSAAAFALVHLTVWGAWALPLDLAAGLVLSWQRWASGRWSVPAVTHVAANVLVTV